jgi:hypothetical protein
VQRVLLVKKQLRARFSWNRTPRLARRPASGGLDCAQSRFPACMRRPPNHSPAARSASVGGDSVSS